MQQARRKPMDSIHRDNGSGAKPYMSIDELSRVTPWTNQAIRSMIAKVLFECGFHFFYVGRRPVFKWTAVVAFIEAREAPRIRANDIESAPHYRDRKKRK